MYISSVELHNYKSYFNTSWIDLAPGFNIVTGQNNAGKTAFLEGVGLTLKDDPHRSVLSKASEAAPLNPSSWVNLKIRLTLDELWRLLAYKGGSVDIAVSFPHHHSDFAREMNLVSHDPDAANTFIKWFISRDIQEFEFKFSRGANNQQKWDTPEPHLSSFNFQIDPGVFM